MTRSQTETGTMSDFADPLTSVTRRGKLKPAEREGFLELDAAGERFELLGPFDNLAQLGDDVEITGVVAPQSSAASRPPSMLVRHVRRL